MFKVHAPSHRLYAVLAYTQAYNYEKAVNNSLNIKHKQFLRKRAA